MFQGMASMTGLAEAVLSQFVYPLEAIFSSAMLDPPRLILGLGGWYLKRTSLEL